MTAVTNAFKIEFVAPFVESMKMLFKTHLHSSLTVGKPTVNFTGEAPYEISGVIGFCGTVEGRAVVSFSRDVAEAIVRKYLGMDELPEEVMPEAVGELANVIAGRAKSMMDEHDVVISPPTIVTGSFSIAPQSGAKIISLPCTTDFGPVQIDMSITAQA